MISTFPITLKELRENPVSAILYLCLIGITIMYIRAESNYKSQYNEKKESIQMCVDKTNKLSTEVSFLTEQVRRSDSALADVRATLRVLKEVGKIQ